MNNINPIELEGISALTLERYLGFWGWERDTNYKNRYIWSFINKNKPNRKIAIPASEKFEDYYSKLNEILKTISLYLNMNVSDLIKELKTTYSDRIEFRIISPLSENGKLPLSYAAECFEGVKDLVLYSACAEENAKPVCLRFTNSAKAYLDKFELGQTEIGSYIINIDTRVVDENNDHYGELIETKKPFEHRVVERIIKSIEQVNTIANEKIRITEYIDDAYENGITANICDSLLKMKPSSGSIEIETTVRYASALYNKPNHSKTISINENHFAIINEIAKIYRDKDLCEDITLQGQITKMVHDKKPENADERTIYIEATIDNRRRTVKATLTETDHIIACDAYKEDKYVEISGELDKSERSWFFSNVTKFHVLQE